MAKVTRSSILTDMKHLGKEPEFDSKELSMVELIRVYNWYNYFKVADDSKRYLEEYCKPKKIKLDWAKHDSPTYGWLARIIDRGAVLDSGTLDKFNRYISKISTDKVLKELIKVESKPPQVVSIHSRLDNWVPEIEEAIDNFTKPFNAYQFIVNANIPQMYVKMIQDRYQLELDEIKAAYGKKDPELNESYRIYNRTELKALMNRLNSIVEDCDKFLNNAKKERRPRKARTRSVESILKHFKYQTTDDELKISSDDPSKIIGAASLYVINTKNKLLTVFHAKEGGLNINRTAITNYDEKTSVTKRVGRNINKIIDSINNGTKRSRVKIIDQIKTNPMKLAERLNENSIIMKVEK